MDYSRSFCILTGSSKGLGKELGRQLLQEGATVLGISRSSAFEHPNYTHISIDLSDIQAVSDLKIEVEGSFENYILINNAASLGPVLPFEELTEEDIISTTNLNFISPLLLTKKLLALPCNENQEKFVLNIGTGASQNAMDGWSLYCSTKAALKMFSRVLYEEIQLNRTNCKVLDLAPGVIDTEMQSKIRQAKTEEFSAVKRFQEMYQHQELQSANTTAALIIRNFSELFNKKLPTDTLRNYM
jgi:benzil reductase ((S)-benzoin forming)